MAETSIFEYNLDNKQVIRLSADVTDPLSVLSISTVVLEEQLGLGSPMLSINMVDGLGDVLGKFLFDPTMVFTLSYGLTEDTLQNATFKFASSKYENASSGSSTNILTTVNFIGSHWEGFLKDTHSRSWTQKRYSAVASTIAAEIGYTADVEETKDFHNVIQPDWTNYQLLKWMAENAVNTKDIGGYFVGLTLDKRLIFRPVDHLAEVVPAATYVLNDSDKKQSDDELDYFRAFLVKNDYVSSVAKAASGVKYMYFDFATGQFINGESKVSTSKQRQLSDVFYIADEHENAPNRYYGGRNTNTPSLSENNVLNSANSINRATISIEGNTFLHAGDVLNMIIPSNLAHIDNVIEEYYSGYWLIERIAHVFNMNNGKVVSNITLIRPGINSPLISGYVKSTKGKKITEL